MFHYRWENRLKMQANSKGKKKKKKKRVSVRTWGPGIMLEEPNQDCSPMNSSWDEIEGKI